MHEWKSWRHAVFARVHLRCDEAFSGVSAVLCFAQHVGFYEQSSVLSAAACTVGLQAFWWKAWMCMWMRAELGVEYEKWEAAFFKLWRLLVVSCIWR